MKYTTLFISVFLAVLVLVSACSLIEDTPEQKELRFNILNAYRDWAAEKSARKTSDTGDCSWGSSDLYCVGMPFFSPETIELTVGNRANFSVDILHVIVRDNCDGLGILKGSAEELANPNPINFRPNGMDDNIQPNELALIQLSGCANGAVGTDVQEEVTIEYMNNENNEEYSINGTLTGRVYEIPMLDLNSKNMMDCTSIIFIDNIPREDLNLFSDLVSGKGFEEGLKEYSLRNPSWSRKVEQKAEKSCKW